MSRYKEWTYEDALELYSRAFELSNEQEIYIVNKEPVEGYKYDYIGEVARALRSEFMQKGYLVNRETLRRDLPNKYEDLKSEWETLKEDLGSNCYSNAKKGIINTAVGIINLKSNHNWTDRNTSEVKVTENRIFESIDLDVEENDSSE